MKNRKKGWLIALLALILLPLAAWAGSQVGIEVTAEKEVKFEQSGQMVTQRVKAETVEPGEVIFYTLTYQNNGDQKATEVVVNNPIPAGAVYLADTAYGTDSTIFFSIDQGQRFDKPQALEIQYSLADGKKITRQAQASEYTHIRWVVGEVAPGGGGILGFQVKVK